MNIQHCLEGIKHNANRISFWEAQGGVQDVTYASLHEGALYLLGGLQRAGLDKGSHLLLKTDGLQPYITALWACWLGGIIPVVSGAQGSWYIDNQFGGPLLTDDAQLSGEGILHFNELDCRPGHVNQMKDDDTALLLYTSGTTAAPRCVALSGSNLYEGGLASSVIVRQGVQERYLGWLPLTHIFGLVGSHLVPLFNGFEHCLMHTRRTLNTPGAWLSACSEYSATITSSSLAGLEHAAAQAEKLPEWVDLSSIYVCLCGGESLREATLQGFETALTGHGWRKGALCPAYGMSEATMGICYNPPGAARRIQHIVPQSIAIGNKLVFTDNDGVERVSLGVLDDCNDVQIRNLQGESLPEGHLGIIHIKGSNVCKGYVPADPSNPDELGWLDTGDLGYFKDGWLTVLARYKDVLCFNGINYIRSELEYDARMASGTDSLAVVEAGAGLVLAGLKGEGEKLERARAALAGQGLPVGTALLDDLPLTGKGTVDRLALEILLEQANIAQEIDTEPDTSHLKGNLLLMAKLWSTRLNIPTGSLEPDSNFILLGGDSLGLIDLACDIEECFDAYVEAEQLGMRPTLRGMCEVVEQARMG